MAVQLNIPYQTLLELIKQLPDEQKKVLAQDLLHQTTSRDLTTEERLALYHTSILSIPVSEEPSIRREDWYDDDGR
jgi:hypothetical protein